MKITCILALFMYTCSVINSSSTDEGYELQSSTENLRNKLKTEINQFLLKKLLDEEAYKANLRNVRTQFKQHKCDYLCEKTKFKKSSKGDKFKYSFMDTLYG